MRAERRHYSNLIRKDGRRLMRVLAVVSFGLILGIGTSPFQTPRGNEERTEQSNSESRLCGTGEARSASRRLADDFSTPSHRKFDFDADEVLRHRPTSMHVSSRLGHSLPNGLPAPLLC